MSDASSDESDALVDDASSAALEAGIKKWQETVMGAYASGRRLQFIEIRAKGKDVEESAWSAQSTIPSVRLGDEDSGVKELGLLPRIRVITVGLDVREYSRRIPEQQIFLTLSLYAAINRAVELLRRAGMIAPDEPRVMVQAGDGAMVVFTSVNSFNPIRKKREEQEYAEEKWRTELRSLPHVAEQAFSFVFAVNCLLENGNKRQGFRVQSMGERPTSPVFPMSVRYAMSYDNVLLMLDVNNALNCAGRGMITCSRILATDHGNHFLIEEGLLRALDPLGGVNGIAGGVWGQRLHSATLPEAKVKSTTVRYADVFGFHSDGPLLTVQGRPRTECGQFQIGSHDVGTLDR